MENIGEKSTGKKSRSGTSKPKSNAAINVSGVENVGTAVAKKEGGRSSNGGGERRKVKIPWQVVELTNGLDQSKTKPSIPMARFDSTPEPTIEVTYIEDSSPKGPSGTGIIGHKRKFSEGEDEIASKEISKKNVLLSNDPATLGNEAKAPHAQKVEVDSIAQNYDAGHNAIGFDLNYPPPDEGAEGDEDGELK